MTDVLATTHSPKTPARLEQVDGLQTKGVLMPVTFLLSATASGKRRNDVRVRMTRPWELQEWELASDEAPAHGGEESAPEPLGIFASGLATCFMTQVRTFSRACGVRVDGLHVDGRFEWKLKPGASPRDPYTAQPESFHLDIDIESEAPLEAQQALVATAAKGCFAEAVLNIPVRHRLRSGDEWIPCAAD